MLRLIRIVRVAELLSGLIALLFLLGLPFPPDSRHRPQWAYLGLVAAGALVLAWRVGRSGRAVWYVVTALAVLILGTLVVHAHEWGVLFHSPPGSASWILVALYGIGQLVALLCASSALRRSATNSEPGAPAA